MFQTITSRRQSRKRHAYAWVLVLLPALVCGVAHGQQKAVTLAAKDAGATLAPQGNYLPTAVVFRTGGQAVTVGIDGVDVVGLGEVTASECKPVVLLGAQAAVTTLRFRDGGRLALTVTAYDEQPMLQLQTAGPSRDGELVLRVGGADRLICRNGGGFGTAVLKAGSGATPVTGSAIALQRRADQNGLSISAVHMRVEAVAGGATVHVPLPAGQETKIVVTGFRGDALIAYEDAVQASGGSAQPGPVEALAARYAEGPAGAPREQPIGRWLWWTGTDRAFRPLLADPREAQVRLGLGNSSLGLSKDFFEAGVGGDIVIAKKRFAEDHEFSTSLRGLIIGRLNRTEESFPLLNTDFIIGPAVGYRRGNNAWEVFLYHESSHLGDETLDNERRARIDYGREAIRFLWSHDFGDLRVYGGPTFNFRGDPDEVGKSVIAQAGAEYRWMAWGTPMYAALDLQSREQNDWNLSATAQIGVELGDPEKVKNRPRVFLEFFDGFSNMGQFWNEREKYIMLGLGYNF